MIAATIIGGTSLSGGSGTIIGTIIGVLIIGVLRNGIMLMGINPFWQQVLVGLVVIGAVADRRLGHGEINRGEGD